MSAEDGLRIIKMENEVLPYVVFYGQDSVVYSDEAAIMDGKEVCRSHSVILAVAHANLYVNSPDPEWVRPELGVYLSPVVRAELQQVVS